MENNYFFELQQVAVGRRAALSRPLTAAGWQEVNERYLALKAATPMAGMPVCQIEYNGFFEEFEEVYSEMGEHDEEARAMLDEIKSDYRTLVVHNLQGRSHVEFRCNGYYWHSLWKDGIRDEADFMELYAEDAREVVRRNLDILRRGNCEGLYLSADMWADWLLTAFVGLLFDENESHKQEAVAIARKLLPEMRDERLRAHVLVHLYYIMREDRLKQEADAIMATWASSDHDLNEEDSCLDDFLQSIS